jgi:RNA polymerase sigma-70 factor (ECF subfamily)
MDQQLIEEIKSGSEESFGILYRKYQAPLFAVCLRYAVDRSLAEDLFQEGLIKLFKKLDHYDAEKGEFLPWARRVLVNNCLNKIRNWKIDQVSVGLEAVHVESVDNSILDKLSFDDMLEIVQSLPKGYRLVFNMFVMDGYSHAEIAEELNISVGASKSQLSKAKKYVAKRLEFFFPGLKEARNYG